MDGENFYGAAYKGSKGFTQQEVHTANATGFGAAADDYAERGIDLNEQLIRNKPATFFFRMKGDAMRDAGIFDNDVLIVDRSLKLANGKVIVTGCLGVKESLIREAHPGVLAVTGPHALEPVMAAVHAALPKPHDPYTDLIPPGGLKLTPRHYAWLKIAEGCNHRCTFCIIPSMRGDLDSRPVGEVMREAESLVKAGAFDSLNKNRAQAFGAGVDDGHDLGRQPFAQTAFFSKGGRREDQDRQADAGALLAGRARLAQGPDQPAQRQPLEQQRLQRTVAALFVFGAEFDLHVVDVKTHQSDCRRDMNRTGRDKHAAQRNRITDREERQVGPDLAVVQMELRRPFARPGEQDQQQSEDRQHQCAEHKGSAENGP